MVLLIAATSTITMLLFTSIHQRSSWAFAGSGAGSPQVQYGMKQTHIPHRSVIQVWCVFLLLHCLSTSPPTHIHARCNASNCWLPHFIVADCIYWVSVILNSAPSLERVDAHIFALWRVVAQYLTWLVRRRRRQRQPGHRWYHSDHC